MTLIKEILCSSNNILTYLDTFLRNLVRKNGRLKALRYKIGRPLATRIYFQIHLNTFKCHALTPNLQCNKNEITMQYCFVIFQMLFAEQIASQRYIGYSFTMAHYGLKKYLIKCRQTVCNESRILLKLRIYV